MDTTPTEPDAPAAPILPLEDWENDPTFLRDKVNELVERVNRMTGDVTE